MIYMRSPPNPPSGGATSFSYCKMNVSILYIRFTVQVLYNYKGNSGVPIFFISTLPMYVYMCIYTLYGYIYYIHYISMCIYNRNTHRDIQIHIGIVCLHKALGTRQSNQD